MVKGVKIFFNLKYSSLLMLLLILPFYAIAKDNTNNTTKNSSNLTNKQSNNSDYKVIKQKINLLPLTPLAILGLNTYLIKVNNINYLVVISVKLKKYNWLIDTIKVRKDLAFNQSGDFVQNIPINLYLTERLELMVAVKKVKEPGNKQNVIPSNAAKITLPYFIAVNNKFNDSIYILKEGKVAINLNSNKPIKLSEDIKIKFNQKLIDNLELLIAFKQNQEQFTNLQNYISKAATNSYKKQK